jgi:hypothetical protein
MDGASVLGLAQRQSSYSQGILLIYPENGYSRFLRNFVPDYVA